MKRMMTLVLSVLGLGGCTVDATTISEGVGAFTTVLNLLKQFGILAMVSVILCGGCAFIKPETKVKIDPIRKTIDVTNSKDVDVDMKGYSSSKTADGGESTSINEISISDKASTVIDANVQQMLAFVQQQKAANEGIAIALSGISEMIKQIVPFLNLTPNTLAAVLNQLKEVDMQIDIANQKFSLGGATTQPTSQPVK